MGDAVEGGSAENVSANAVDGSMSAARAPCPIWSRVARLPNAALRGLFVAVVGPFRSAFSRWALGIVDGEQKAEEETRFSTRPRQ